MKNAGNGKVAYSETRDQDKYKKESGTKARKEKIGTEGKGKLFFRY